MALKLLKVEHNILPKIELAQALKVDILLPTVENSALVMSNDNSTAKYADFAERLNKLMRQTDSPIKTVRDLQAVAGVTYEMARRYTLGAAKPRDERLEKIAQGFDVSTSYLDHGDEISQSSQAQSQNEQPQKQYQGASDSRLFTQIDKNFKIAHIKFAEPDGTQPVVRIPVYRDIKAACGDGFENFLEDPSDYIEMHPLVLQMLGIDSKPSNLKIIYSVEDSMYPTVPHDKPLFIDVSDKDPTAIKNGRIYVFTHRYGCRMKRIFTGYDENGNTQSIRLASDNPDKNMFPDEWITQDQLNEINFVGRLVWTGKEL